MMMQLPGRQMFEDAFPKHGRRIFRLTFSVALLIFFGAAIVGTFKGISYLRAELGSPKNSVPAAKPTIDQPVRDPNALYQFDHRVGTAVGANIMRATGIVTFVEVYGVGELNDQETFKYQDLTLKFESADDKASLHAAMTLFGISKCLSEELLNPMNHL